MTSVQPQDQTIVRAAIHPGIGVARIGDSKSGFFIGPEVTAPPPQRPDVYRDANGLKRQAARFRLYGYNAGGEVVRELTPADATIEWTVHLANKKAQWYQFQAALDIPEAASFSVIRRNQSYPKRSELAIDPGPRSISGKSTSGPQYQFDTGKFKTTVVPLGEIRTDENGHLIVLGGTGQSASPGGAPVFDPSDPNSFNNANDWYDDTSDGPVTATVSIGGSPIPVEPAWVVVTPPNYAPDIISWRTMYEEMQNIYIQAGVMDIAVPVSFADDVLPILQRQSNLQWVNAGYAAMFGKGRPMDFDNPDFVAMLAQVPTGGSDPYLELRQSILNSFRPPLPSLAGQPDYPHVWPWIYGDAFGTFSNTGTGNMLPMTNYQYGVLKHWVQGSFKNDWPPQTPPKTIDEVPLAQQPAMLDKAALHFCLSDTFHPGCEMTWPMRHGSVYAKPFRIRHRPPGATEQDYGANLTQPLVLQADGPLYAQGPGDITRWMALPWQGDTAFCRSGYDPQFDPYLPTFWAARVPNQVLTEEDYVIAVDTKQPREARLAAFNRRASWLRAIDGPDVAKVMERMIKDFGNLGIVEARPGVEGDKELPAVMYVENLPPGPIKTVASEKRLTRETLGRAPTALERAGWQSEAHLHAFRSVRVRNR